MTDLYAVIGNPVAQSKSPRIHAEFARQLAQDLRYKTILAPREGFAAAVAAFRAGGGRGLNVTVPFKLEAFELATERTERAEQAGAVNTLKFEGATALGDNTDGAGLVSDIENRLRLLDWRQARAAHGRGRCGARRGAAAAAGADRPRSRSPIVPSPRPRNSSGALRPSGRCRGATTHAWRGGSSTWSSMPPRRA